MSREAKMRERISALEAEVARLRGKLLEVKLLVKPWREKGKTPLARELERRGLAVTR